MILEDTEDKIIGEEREKKKTEDQDQNQKIKEETKKREAEDHLLQSQGILRWIVSL